MRHLESMGDPVGLPVAPEGLRSPEDGQARQFGVIEVVELGGGGDTHLGHAEQSIKTWTLGRMARRQRAESTALAMPAVSPGSHLTILTYHQCDFVVLRVVFPKNVSLSC